LTRLINEKRTDWDEHTSTILFSYKTTYKVAIGYTPHQLIYGLHPLMQIEYVLLAISGDHKNVEPNRIIIAIITKLRKLQENILAQNNVRANQWSKFMWSQ
jgi:hypothetical protein